MKIYCLNHTLMRQKAVGEKDCMCQFSFSLSLKVIFKARQFWSSKPQLVWISETQGLRNKWACSCPLLPLYPLSPLPLQMQINMFHSDFSYKNMSVSRHWLWNEEPQKSLTKLACGKADLSECWNRTVIGAPAFCDSYLPLLIGRWGCFMCSFPGVRTVPSACDTLVLQGALASSKQIDSAWIFSPSKINPGSTVT